MFVTSAIYIKLNAHHMHFRVCLYSDLGSGPALRELLIKQTATASDILLLKVTFPFAKFLFIQCSPLSFC